MKKYSVKHTTIIDLHERGYGEDFQLIGNDLFWCQGKKMIPCGEFEILEYYVIIDKNPAAYCLVILGVIAVYHGIKGILINNCATYPFPLAPVIRKKLNDKMVTAPGGEFFNFSMHPSNKLLSNEN